MTENSDHFILNEIDLWNHDGDDVEQSSVFSVFYLLSGALFI